MTTFNVYKENNFGDLVLIASDLIDKSYSDSDVEYGKRYKYQIGAVKSGSEKKSEIFSFYTGDGDEFWENVAVLMHFNSNNGSTTSFYEEKNQVFLPRLGSTYIEDGGRFNQGVFFGRSGARAVQIPASYYALKNNDFTFNISLSFTQLNTDTFYDICGQRGDYSSNQSYAFYYYTGNGKFHFEFSSDGTSMNYVTFDHLPNLNAYHDYQLKRNGDQLILEVDGVEVGSANLPTGFTFFESTAHHQLAVSSEHIAPTTQTHPTWFDEFRVTIGVARNSSVLTSEFKNHL